MADSTKLILLGGAAAAAWYFYFRNPVVAAPGAAPAPAPAPSPRAGSPAAPPPAPPPSPTAPTLATIEARTLAAANAPAEGLTIDEWGWFLNQQLAPLGKAAPDPWPLFSDIPAFDRSVHVNAAKYWERMEPALRSQLGLSGFHGLGFFGMVQ